MTHASLSRAFTLIETLLVVSLLVLLVSISIIAINPKKQLSDSRDAEREVDVVMLVQTLYQYASDHDGAFPNGITTELREVCRTGASDCAGLHDLSTLTENDRYVVALPLDPQCDALSGVCAANGTGYFAQITANGRVYVSASSSENSTISLTQ